VVVAGGKGEDLVQMFALDPELQFTGKVTAVLSALEHGDHDDLHGDGSRRS